MRQKTAISSLGWASLQARREFPNKIQGTRTTTKRKENERSETKKTMVLFNWKDWRWCVCGRREGGGRRRRRRRVSHCYWCVLYCLSKYSGSFILSLREPSPLNINIIPLKARIMWGNWDYLPIRRLAELLFACLEETLPKDSYCIREQMGNMFT